MALEEARYEIEGDSLRVEGELLTPDELLRERVPVHEGWIAAAEGEVSIELDTDLDDELSLEGDAYELIHVVNTLRKERGLELTDRIVLTVPEAQRELVDHHGEWIKGEVLAVDLNYGAELALEKS